MSELKSANINMWRESLNTSISSFFGVVSDIVHVFILVRLLSQDQVGIFFISYAFLYLFAQIPRGIGIAIRKRASEVNTGQSKYLWTGFILILPLLAVLFLGLWLFQPILNTYSYITLSDTVLVGLFLATTGFSTLEFARFYMAGCGEPGRAEKLRTLLAKTSMPIITVLLVSTVSTVAFALYSVFIAYFMSSILIFLLTPHKLVLPNKETLIDIIGFSKWSVATSLLNDFYHRWDTLLLGFLVGSVAVGYYDSSVRIAFLATTFAVGVSKTSNVKMSGMREIDKDITNIASKTIEVSTFLIFPLLLISLFNAEYMLSVLFTPEYTGAKIYLILLVIIQIFQAYRMQFESICNSTDNPNTTTKISLIVALINVATAPFLVLQFGGYGVLYSTLLSEIARMILYQISIKNILHTYIIPKGVFIQYGTIFILSGLLYSIHTLRLSDLQFFIVSCLISTIGFYSLQYYFSEETREIVKEYQSILK